MLIVSIPARFVSDNTMKKGATKDKKTKNSKKVIMLLDSHALLHRGYHAMGGFTTYDGRPTGALFGFLKMINKASDEVNPDYIIAAYDLPKPTFRHLAYNEYKGTRSKSDDDLKVQIDQSKDFCKALGIPVCALEGFEADDVIGTLAKRFTAGGEYKVVIVSGDMDTMQLVDEYISVLTPKKGSEIALFTPKEVKERYGIDPNQIVEYKALAGDSSDNIPGVEGIGEKTAIKLIDSFGTVDGLYETLKSKPEVVREVVSQRILESLERCEEEAFFSKTLATIRLDTPIEVTLDATWPYGVDKEEYKKLCDLYELRTLRMVFDDNVERGVIKKKKELKEVGEISITIDALNGEDEAKWIESITDEQLIELRNMYILIDSEKLAPTYDEIKTAIGIYNDTNFDTVRATLVEKLKETGVWEYYLQIEEKITPIIKEMEEWGVLVDKEELERQKQVVREKIASTEKEIYELAGTTFLISSPKQLGDVLYDQLQLGTKIKKTATGQRTTNAEMLEKLKGEHPIIEKILEWREVSKIYGTYLDPMLGFVHADGRVHPHFIQAGSATGRFACENPNMQNLPIKSEIGQLVRKIFVVSPGYTFLSLDYSQIDLRAAAMLSGDPNLISIFENNQDVHLAVAARVLHKSPEEVTSEERRKAKAINFGILYGMGVTSLKDAMHAERSEAQEFYDRYKESYNTLMQFLEKVKQDTTRDGYTTTLFGRRRYVPLIRSKLPFLKAQGERIAINAPIQGTSADILKLAMIDVRRELATYFDNNELKLILQIHDELVFEVKESLAEELSLKIQSIMKQVLEKRKSSIKQNLIPLEASIGTGQDLGALK